MSDRSRKTAGRKQGLPYHGEPLEYVRTMPYRGDDLAWRRMDPLAVRAALLSASPPQTPAPPTAFLGRGPEQLVPGYAYGDRERNELEAGRRALLEQYRKLHGLNPWMAEQSVGEMLPFPKLFLNK